jgi:hypothetical protein
MNWLDWLLGFEWLIGLFKKKAKATRLVLTPSTHRGPVGTTVTVTAKVLEADKMAPIANAKVLVTVTDPSGAKTADERTTDDSGSFGVTVVLSAAGDYSILVEYGGEANKWLGSVASTVISALPAAVLTSLTLTPSATTGTVGDTIIITASLQS